jgi:hypothetical protein
VKARADTFASGEAFVASETRNVIISERVKMNSLESFVCSVIDILVNLLYSISVDVFDGLEHGLRCNDG